MKRLMTIIEILLITLFLNGCVSIAKCDAYGSNVEKNKDISEV